MKLKLGLGLLLFVSGALIAIHFVPQKTTVYKATNQVNTEAKNSAVAGKPSIRADVPPQIRRQAEVTSPPPAPQPAPVPTPDPQQAPTPSATPATPPTEKVPIDPNAPVNCTGKIGCSN